MAYDSHSKLWPLRDESFFATAPLKHLRQVGGTCVSTTLAQLTSESPEYFQPIINTQDPVSWSESLRPWKMKLAYCPTDIRKIKWYAEELVNLGDLFVLCYYTEPGEHLLGDPDETGWLTSSHIVTLHLDKVYDTNKSNICQLRDHSCMEQHTKRIFRVVPSDHPRGL